LLPQWIEMPTISSFYGILIRMLYNDHDPPHFQALYGEFQATIDIERLGILGRAIFRVVRLTWCWIGPNCIKTSFARTGVWPGRKAPRIRSLR
jgi:Domain of unknown function (DUF4160)